MADFPSIEPTTRGWGFGAFSGTQITASGGGGVRFSHSTTALRHVLSLGFEGLTEAQTRQVRQHYTGQQGGDLSFYLPSVIWQGLTSPTDVVPSTARWKYASAVDEPTAMGPFFDLQVDLEHVGPEPP